MPKFRKKPIVIEAFQMTKERIFDNKDWPEWLNQAWQLPAIRVGAVSHNHAVNSWLDINTLEGFMTVKPGDWIIRGVMGEIYPCKPDIFAATYELEEEPAHED